MKIKDTSYSKSNTLSSSSNSKNKKLPDFPTRVNRLRSRLFKDPLLLTLLVFSALYFLFYYLTDPVRPANIFNGWFGFRDTAQYPLGWFGFTDQSYYLKLAHTLASFNFHQLHSTFLYGLGYPLVAVPFIWLGFNKDPFLFFNLCAFIFAVYVTYRVARNWISPAAGLLAGFGLVFATPLIHYTDQPWNSTVCLVVACYILLLSTFKAITKWHVFLLGLLVGWSFSARYIDAAFLGLLAIASVYRGSVTHLFKQLVFLSLGMMVFIIPVLYLQSRIFGSPFRTPYSLHIMSNQVGSDQQLSSYSLKAMPRKAVAILAGPRLLGLSDSSRGLLVDMFWALAAIPGTYILCRKARHKLFVISLASFIILVSVFYLSFRGTAVDSVRFGLLHYFKMLWPGTVILAVAFFEHQFSKGYNTRSK